MAIRQAPRSAAAGGVVLFALLAGCAAEDPQPAPPADTAMQEPAPEEAEGAEGAEEQGPEEQGPAEEGEADDAAAGSVNTDYSDIAPDAGHSPPEHFPADPLEGLDEFYGQQVDWQDCESGMHCGAVTVPKDYDDPDGETIEIEFISDSVDDAPFLLMNPGGPGSSGYEIVAEQVDWVFTSELQDAYNIVGFDPRGVARSAPLECMEDEEYDLWNQLTGDETLDADLVGEAVDFTDVVAQCQELSGDIIEHVDTVSAARDMDIMRDALGQERLHYFGMSYGTKLGLAYAEIFPEQVGRWALDGVMDTSISISGVTADQSVGFERQLWEFAEYCAEREDCPIEGEAEDVVEGIDERIDEMWDNPVEASDGRLISAATIFSGLSTTMYVPGGQEALLLALTDWIDNGDPEYFQYLSDIYDGRNPDGSYDWISSWSFRTIMCLDYPLAGEGFEGPGLLDEETPFTDQFIGTGTEYCQALPTEPAGAPWEPSDELPQILLVGGTEDPATPVEWAQNMHSMMPNSALLLYEGEGHISYRPDNPCVADIVDGYFIDGELFEGQQTCSS
ncbi:alpha/beta hydrolase [Nesterenkonia alkaliphila]|uniref:Alpha/beta fold hydrolase n=1 Tax=Nesterenkonia alkaliphila TaxID=1463631 RepID=A0A7K1UL37_9MICC|nr:alpha/beta hydrolase [Nesterenkonia alkaliphila]MVT27134.1 alpha/beta fold hydrolase [Nesterenkonia alkaliphila]GFZ97736.1 alpha/beta hydrolase [Nesterenkonia alkaliphila]